MLLLLCMGTVRVYHCGMSNTRYEIRLMTVAETDYLTGLAAGRKDASTCVSVEDVLWFQRVTFDNLWTTRPRYVTGYVDGFAR